MTIDALNSRLAFAETIRQRTYESLKTSNEILATVWEQIFTLVRDAIIDGEIRVLTLDDERSRLDEQSAVVRIEGVKPKVLLELGVERGEWRLRMRLEEPDDTYLVDLDSNWDLYVALRVAISEQIAERDPQMTFPFSPSAH